MSGTRVLSAIVAAFWGFVLVRWVTLGRWSQVLVFVVAGGLAVCGLVFYQRRSSAKLSSRERDVAKLAAEGATSRQIAEVLQLSAVEVKRCLDALYKKAREE